MFLQQVLDFFTTKAPLTWVALCSGGRDRPKGSWLFWLGLSLGVASYYGFQALWQGLSHPYIIQDDVRQHVFWMARFVDPELFAQDLIADYFESVAPPGYTAVYWVLSQVGLEPLLVSKVLPLLLGGLATVYGFGVCREILPVPPAAFLGTLILNQSLWLKNDLVSATPRAFLYPLFLAFLYYLLRRAWVPCLLTIALFGGFYPHFVLLAIAILGLRLLGRWQGSQGFADARLLLLALVLAIAVLLPYKLGPDPYGPIVTLAQAQLQPEFGPQGRSFFFQDNPWIYWLTGERSGLLFLPLPPVLLVGLALPWLLHHPERFPLAKQVRPQVGLLVQILVASGGLFLLAHLLLFQLHLPSRYVQHSLRVVLALAAGLALAIALEPWFRVRPAPGIGLGVRRVGWQVLVGLVLGINLILPLLPQVSLFYQDWVVGTQPELYAYLRQQPKATLVASLSREASNLPTFTQRPVLVAREYALPYHRGYYVEFRQRSLDLIQAQYSPDLASLQAVIRKYGIELWLVDRQAFTPAYLEQNDWLQPYQPALARAIAQLHSGIPPAIARLINSCRVPELEGPIVLQAACILETTSLPPLPSPESI